MSRQKHSNTDRIGGPGASHENRKQPENPGRMENEKSTFSPTARANGSKLSGPAISVLTSKATGQTFARIRSGRATVVQRKHDGPHITLVAQPPERIE
jgi:hypothetical protein